MILPFTGTHKVTQPFGVDSALRPGSKHNGIDFSMPINTPLVAAQSGTVVSAGVDKYGARFIIIRNGKIDAKYWHLNKFLVSLWQTVKQGQLIAYSGNTGLSSGPHLHFGTTVNGVAVNPYSLINQPQAAAPTLEPVTSVNGSYTIRKNDTFWAIEERLGLAHGTLQKLNPSLDPKKLVVGSNIKTSQPSTPGKSNPQTYYTVRRNDTFWGLELAWRLPHGTLQKLNPGVNPKRLKIGQKIRRS